MQDETLKAHRRWMRKAIILPVAGVVLIGGIAAAAWLLEANGTGTTTIQAGTSGNAPALVVSASPADSTALTPGATENVKWSATNTSGNAENLTSVVVAVTGTTNNSACPASNFTVTQGTIATDVGATVSLPYTWNTGVQLDDYGSGFPTAAAVTMIPSAPVGCEGVGINVSVTLS